MAYQVDISEIVEETGGSVYADAPYSLESYAVGEDTYTLTAPATVDAMLTNTGESAIVATGTVSVDVNAVCSRCLCEFPLHVTADIEGYYIRPGHADNLPDEQEVEFIGDDDTIDLEPALHAAIVLETPFAPLHDAECAGICSTCGADLNEGDCGCAHEETVDEAHPFAGLKDLLGAEEKPADEG